MPRAKKIVDKPNVEKTVEVKTTPAAFNLMNILLIIVTLFSLYLFYKIHILEQKLAAATTTTPTQQGQQQPTGPSISIGKVKALFSKGYMNFGNANNKLLFVEVTDPSCPFCHVAGGQDPETSKSINSRFQYVSDGGSYDPPVTEMKKLVDTGKASMVFLYSPGHGNGELAAQALYCAYEKGQFWPVHDRLMSNAGYNTINNDVRNDTTKIPVLVDFLSQQIDSNFLSSCLTSGKYASMLKRDEQVSQSLGYQGTPYFLINTTTFNGAYDWGSMSSVVNKALQS